MILRWRWRCRWRAIPPPQGPRNQAHHNRPGGVGIPRPPQGHVADRHVHPACMPHMHAHDSGERHWRQGGVAIAIYSTRNIRGGQPSHLRWLTDSLTTRARPLQRTVPRCLRDRLEVLQGSSPPSLICLLGHALPPCVPLSPLVSVWLLHVTKTCCTHQRTMLRACHLWTDCRMLPLEGACNPPSYTPQCWRAGLSQLSTGRIECSASQCAP